MLVTERERLREELVGAGRPATAASAARLMPILQEVQRRHFHISEYCMQVIADLLDIHPVEVHSVVSFYSFLDEQPQGQFVIRLCRTITCDMAGKEHVARQLENDLGIDFGETTPDGKFSLRLGQLPGDVRPGAGDAGQRAGLHPASRRRRSTASWSECRQTFGVHAMADGKEHAAMTHGHTTNRCADVSRRSSPAAGCAAALARPPADVLARDRPLGPARARRRRLSHQPEVGAGRQVAGRARSTSSATPTKASPAPSRTA